MTLLQNVTTISGLLTSANDYTGNILFMLLIIVVWAVVFLSLMTRFGNINAFVTANFLVSVLSLFLVNAGLLNVYVLIVCVLLLVTSIFMRMVQKNRVA